MAFTGSQNNECPSCVLFELCQPDARSLFFDGLALEELCYLFDLSQVPIH
jgi:hypothetical protein